MNKEKELLPCPFCGSIPFVVEDDGYGGCLIMCKCDVEPCVGAAMGQLDEAVAKWNRRPEASIEQEQVAQWIPVSEKMPKPGAFVLAFLRNDLGKGRRIRALHYPKHSKRDEGDFESDTDYDEATDESYWPEGWYEANEYEETHWFVHHEVTHWMPLPEPPETGTEATIAAAQIIPEGSSVERIEEAKRRIRRAMKLFHNAEHHWDNEMAAEFIDGADPAFTLLDWIDDGIEQVAVESIEQDARCNWTQGSDGEWNTDCGHIFEFTTGTPADNHAAFCQYCGGVIAAIQEKEHE